VNHGMGFSASPLGIAPGTANLYKPAPLGSLSFFPSIFLLLPSDSLVLLLLPALDRRSHPSLLSPLARPTFNGTRCAMAVVSLFPSCCYAVIVSGKHRMFFNLLTNHEQAESLENSKQLILAHTDSSNAETQAIPFPRC